MPHSRPADAFAVFWSGLPPIFGVCPGVDEEGVIHALPQLATTATRQDFLDYFDNGWTLTETLFSGLASAEAFLRRPYHGLRHPMLFYYGHPVTVYVNKLRVAGLMTEPLHAGLEQLFDVGVDEMRWDDLHDGDDDIWPALDEVRTYRERGYRLIRTLIETHPGLEAGAPPITPSTPLWALMMGFEHERIHLETSSVLIRELPVADLRVPPAWPQPYSRAPALLDNPMLPQPGGPVRLGKPIETPSFGWDNEYGDETRFVRPFSASACLVRNEEFHAFVAAGGYGAERYWSREGWQWRGFRNVKGPSFWVPEGPAGLHHYRLRTVFESIAWRGDWPVCVNFHEAKAYCAWKSERENASLPYRLLTEAEHVFLRGDAAPVPANLGLQHGSESAVRAFPPNARGVHDAMGNLWQWCEDHFHPLPGSAPHPYYDDFSTPCYDGEHHMMLGGSFASCGDEASIWARFHFRPHFFQHAGFRLVQSGDGNSASDARLIAPRGAASYETQAMVDNYLLMHWGSDAELWGETPSVTRPIARHLPLACAELVVRYAARFERALDLGCAVGRSSFELARHFQAVVGVDYSREFIACATALQETGEQNYSRKDSGSSRTSLTARVPEDIDRHRLRFEQGDACALPLHLKGFDAVLLANVLCRLPDPAACLARMQGENALIAPGGVLVMTTPFSWLESFTPPAKWLPGVEALRPHLPDFTLLLEEDIPFLIRDHARRFEYIITRASVWRRNG